MDLPFRRDYSDPAAEKEKKNYINKILYYKNVYYF